MKTNAYFTAIKITFVSMLLLKVFMLSAQHAILGTTDINAYIQQAPGLPATTDEAMMRAGTHPLNPDHSALDRHYLPFEEKVGRRIQDYKDFAKQKMEKGGATEADYQREAAAMANTNPVIAGMGGYEKVSQMSESEARAAAQQAANTYMADPLAASGVQSAGMAAMYQKIMNDPVYAKKFQKMSDAEKEAELRKFMANDKPVSPTQSQMQAQQQQAANQQNEAQLIRNMQEVQLSISEWIQRQATIKIQFEEKIQAIEQAGRSHSIIAEEIRKRHDAIPIVDLGEYGHDHDPEMVRLLGIEAANLHRLRAQAELEEKAAAMQAYSNDCQSLVTEYLEYLQNNFDKVYGGTSAADMLKGINTEQPLLAFEMNLLNMAVELSQYSRELTKRAAQWEGNYVLAVQGN